MVILRSVLKVKFTKYCTCAAKNPGELKEYSREWTGFFIILELEPYMLEAYLGNDFQDTVFCCFFYVLEAPKP